VPAWLTPGEVVLPVGMVEVMRRIMESGGAPSSSPAMATGGTVLPRGRGGETNITIRGEAGLASPAVFERLCRDRLVPTLRALQRKGLRV
jgi:hypothetical protein